MTRPLIILQNNHVARLTGPVAEIARSMEVDLIDVSSGPAAETMPLVEPSSATRTILIFGSTWFIREWASKRPDLARCIHWSVDAFDASTWNAMLDTDMLNHQGFCTTIAEFERSALPSMHLRPRGDMKFVGNVVPTEDRTGQRSLPGIVVTPERLRSMNIDGDTQIWAAPVQEIMAEVRIWMIDGRPVCASTYRVEGAMHLSTTHPHVAKAVDFARLTHMRWNPARHYVVDMALVESGWRVVEFNPHHSAGWYAADVRTILDALVDAGSMRGDDR